jgi:hypothetical protein
MKSGLLLAITGRIRQSMTRGMSQMQRQHEGKHVWHQQACSQYQLRLNKKSRHRSVLVTASICLQNLQL